MWSKLLSPLRIEPTPEADFESRFIEDFHRRLKQEPARVSLTAQLMERVKYFMTDFAGRRWATAATTALVVAFVVGGLMWPESDMPKAVASVGSPVEQVVEQQKRTVADIAPSVLVNRDSVMASKMIAPIHEVSDSEEEQKKKEQESPAEITPEPSAE